MNVREWIAEWEPEALFMDGYDEALVGVVERYGMPPVALYDTDCIIGLLVRDGCSPEEAHEFFCFNMEGAWVGEHTPAFVTFAPKEVRR